jgi:hypothetical protein
MTMRIALPIAALAAILCVDIPSSQAQAGNAPWCAVVQTGAGQVERDCDYFSIEECAPNVIAGNRGFCQINPYYTAVQPRVARHGRHWRHHRRYR